MNTTDHTTAPPTFAVGVDPAHVRRVSAFYNGNGWDATPTFRGRIVATRLFDHLGEWHLVIARGEADEDVIVKFQDNPLGIGMLEAAREDAIVRCGGRP